MAGSTPTCLKCKHPLELRLVEELTAGRCGQCQRGFEFIAFPALLAVPTVARAQSAQALDDAVCFFHAENRAESVCENCGRYLCTVCGVEFGGSRLCPQCVSLRRASDSKRSGRDLVLHDTIGLALAVGPLLVFWLTLITAPVALGYVIFAWRQPLSILRRSRWRLVLAGTLAVLEILGWIIYGIAG